MWWIPRANIFLMPVRCYQVQVSVERDDNSRWMQWCNILVGSFFNMYHRWFLYEHDNPTVIIFRFICLKYVFYIEHVVQTVTDCTLDDDWNGELQFFDLPMWLPLFMTSTKFRRAVSLTIALQLFFEIKINFRMPILSDFLECIPLLYVHVYKCIVVWRRMTSSTPPSNHYATNRKCFNTNDMVRLNLHTYIN